MKAFVTGATGLVGGWIVEALISKGIEPVCLVRDAVPTCRYKRTKLDRFSVSVNGDLSDHRFLNRILVEYEIDTVFHLAAQTIVRYGNESPLATFEANIRGTWNLLEACREKKGIEHVIVASSDKAYGDQEPPYVEDMPMMGQYPYDVSKSCGDLIARSYYKTYKLPVTVVRCSNIYGPGDLNWSRIIPRTLRYALKGDVALSIRGKGEMKRDYLFYKDAVSAYMTCANNPVSIGKVFNFGSGKSIDTASLVRMIYEAAGVCKELPPLIEGDGNEIKDQWMDCMKAYRALQWVPKYELAEGLKETAEWYLNYLSGSIDETRKLEKGA